MFLASVILMSYQFSLRFFISIASGQMFQPQWPKLGLKIRIFVSKEKYLNLQS